MRYYLVDHISEIQRGRSIKGVKNIAMSEDFLTFHFPDNPIMPGSLLLEALVQLAGWLEAESSRFSYWILLSKAKKGRYYGFARPGDQVILEVLSLPAEDSVLKLFKGIGRCRGKKVIDVEFEGLRRSLPQLQDPLRARRLFQILTEPHGVTPDG
jgi:3-hydroxyacyl-[acyl-carrier-protein] dehydratase